MTKTRNNHYVPQWYQEGFFEPDRNTLAYLDLQPAQKRLDDGRTIVGRALFDAPTSRAFFQIDLYSTFFGNSINDEIERRLFGEVDARGSRAVRAFAGPADINEWHRNYQTLFEYIDVQKIRTPKGLDWLKAQYPDLTQNELMFEMQGIRSMLCTIWSEGVHEIVSAEDAGLKFIISDHPVTIYNYAASPAADECRYPNDPGIALRATQTIFPLNRNFCLIITNLEYAKDTSTPPLEKRTFARNYRNSMVRTDGFIHTRKLSDDHVAQINYIVKLRARRYVAAGRQEWLYPERQFEGQWSDLRTTLQPPENGLWHFGGEIIAKFDSGHVHYQDEFGRTEQPRDFLVKQPPSGPLRSRDLCGCGSGRSFGACCSSKPVTLRPSWDERSIRERNIMLLNGIDNVLRLSEGRDWISVRRDLTDEQISKVYGIFEALWPLETDLLKLLPKPDGSARAVYTGPIHPATIVEFALAAPLYFGELIVEHPFVHAGIMKKEFSPVHSPKKYRQEFLKTVLCFLTIMPLVEHGLVNLIPDPCNFDSHLRDEMLRMATARSAGIELSPKDEPRIEELMRQDFQRGLWSMPRDALRREFLKSSPGLDGTALTNALSYVDQIKQEDPLAVLQEGSLAGGKEGGQLNMIKLAPNFEMVLYIAQATGSSIVTDSPMRWREIKAAIARRLSVAGAARLASLENSIRSATFAFPQVATDIATLDVQGTMKAYAPLMRDAFKYLSNYEERGRKPNVEASLNGYFVRAHASAQATISRIGMPIKHGKVLCAFPAKGLQDNNVNRLLLMSSSEKHLLSVPMAFFIQEHKAA